MHPFHLSLLLLTAVPSGAGTPAIVLSEGRVISAADWSIGPDGAVIVTAAVRPPLA